MRALAQKYNCELIDLNEAMRREVAVNGTSPADLFQGDGVPYLDSTLASAADTIRITKNNQVWSKFTDLKVTRPILGRE